MYCFCISLPIKWSKLSNWSFKNFKKIGERIGGFSFLIQHIKNSLSISYTKLYASIFCLISDHINKFSCHKPTAKQLLLQWYPLLITYFKICLRSNWFLFSNIWHKTFRLCWFFEQSQSIFHSKLSTKFCTCIITNVKCF